MQKIKIQTLLDLIDDVVNNEDGSYAERRDAILAECNEQMRITLDEFISWFEPSQ